MYVLFEGIDTCGKSTQIELISKKHPEIVITHEPGGTAFGKKAREILLSDSLASKRAELLLFLAESCMNIMPEIQKDINQQPMKYFVVYWHKWQVNPGEVISSS